MGLFYQITDDAFPGAKSIDFIGQRIVYVEPFGRYWGWSDLVDASSWNSLETAQAETSPDRIQGLIVSHNEVLVFGERTIEPWSSAPTDTAVFQLQVGSVIESGCAAGKTIKRLDNSVFYLTNSGQVARLNGYTPQIVSTQAMETAIRGLNWSRAFAFTWEDSGHAVYYITFPDGNTWGYDARQGRWHRRESFGLDRWRVNALVKSNRTWFAGDFQSGRIYELEWGNVYEGCEIMPRKLRTGVLHNAQNRIPIHGFQVVASSGVPATVGATTAPVVYPASGLLVTGSAVGGGSDFVFATAEPSASPVFTGIPTATGADMAAGIGARYGDLWSVVATNAGRYSQDNLESWQTGAITTSGFSPYYIIAGPDGWLARLSSDYNNSWFKADDPTSTWAAFSPDATMTNGSNGDSQAEAAFIGWYTGGYYYMNYQRTLLRSATAAGPYTAVRDQFKNTAEGLDNNGAVIVNFLDGVEYDGKLYCAVIFHFNEASQRYQIRWSPDGGLTFPDANIVYDVAIAGGKCPVQLVVCGEHIVAYCNGGGLLTSADGWTNWIDIGLVGPSASEPEFLDGGRRLAVANGLVFCIGTLAGVSKCVVFDPSDLSVSDPIDLPIITARSIVTSFDAEVDTPPTLEECTPMESGTFQLRYSDDGANNYSNWRDFAYPTTGQFMQPLIARRLGMTRHRVWEIMDTSNRPQEILAASIILE